MAFEIDATIKQGWVDFFARTPRFDVFHQEERYRKILRTNVISAIVSFSLALVVLVAVLVYGRVFTIVIGAVLALMLAIYGIMSLRKRLSLLRQSAGQPGLAFGVSTEGIHTPVLPTIPWSDVLAVFVMDESRHVDYALSLKGMKGLTARYARANGRGARHINVVLPEGAALRQQVRPPEYAKVVELWSHFENPKFGVLSYTLDPTVDIEQVRQISMATAVLAEQNGVTTTLSEGAADFIEHMGNISKIFD